MTSRQRPAKSVFGSCALLLVASFFQAAIALAVLPASPPPAAAPPPLAVKGAPGKLVPPSPAPAPASLGAMPAAQQIYPVAYPVDRYAELMDNSPFALATPPAAAPPPEHLFCEGWKLKAISYLPNENGVPTSFVVVKTADARDSMAFWGNEPVHGGAGDGAVVTAINLSSETGKTTVMIKKGTEVGKIEADPMDVQGAPPSPQPPQQHTPGQPGGAIQGGRGAPNQQFVPRPRIAVPGSSPGPTYRPPNNSYVAPNPAAAPPQNRRSLRVIPSP